MVAILSAASPTGQNDSWRSQDGKTVRYVFTNMDYKLALKFAERKVVTHTQEEVDAGQIITDYTGRAERYREQFKPLLSKAS